MCRTRLHPPSKGAAFITCIDGAEKLYHLMPQIQKETP